MAPRRAKKGILGKGALEEIEAVTFGAMQPPPASSTSLTVFKSTTNDNNNIFAYLSCKEKDNGKEKEDESMGEGSEDELAATSSTTVSSSSSTPQKKPWEEHIGLGIKAFQEASNLATKVTTKEAIKELLTHALSVQQGKLLCSFSSLQEIAKELKALRLSLT